jgi:hypothetical protein
VPNEEPIHLNQPRSTFSTWLGMVLLFGLFGMIAFVLLKGSARGDTYEKKRAKARSEKLQAAQKEYLNSLTTYAWVDKAKGVVRIPVDHAMQLTLAQLANTKPTAAEPIAAESQAAAPQTSPGPSASASPAASPAATDSGTPKPKAVEGHDSEAHNQPAAAANPPAAPPNTQPGASASPAASVPSQSAKAPVTPATSVAPTVPPTPLPKKP